jgi:hypothetical protein
MRECSSRKRSKNPPVSVQPAPRRPGYDEYETERREVSAPESR